LFTRLTTHHRRGVVVSLFEILYELN
jgi:hypothetical protein